VCQPLPLPPAGAWGRRLQERALKQQVARAARTLGLCRAPLVTWFSVPIAAPLLGSLGESVSVFYYQDRYAEFSHVDRERLTAQTRRLAEDSDLALASAEPLAEDLRLMGAEPVLVPHGVDAGRFAPGGTPPGELERLERPLVGCVGLIDDYWDVDAIVSTAERLSSGTIVIVGGTNVATEALEHERIVLLGPRPYDEIPAYMTSFDCCILPFALTRLTEAVNPIKLREYLAAGRPVVSTPLPEVLGYRDVVTIAPGPDEFASAVLRVLADPDDETAQQRRRARVAGETWDHAADRIREMIDDALSSPSRRAERAQAAG
jgi:glycosyltransferase involved in cell wall biosynthesis